MAKRSENHTLLIEMYTKMLEIRLFEETIEKLFFKNLIGGSVHSYIGQEAVAVGVCSALQAEDYIVSTHRGHGHCIAKGGKPEKIMAEILGKEAGYCKGKGGSMHVSDMETRNLGANGIVGAGIPIASGAGLALKMKGGGHLVACFFGDGAANTGAFHEGVNLAAIWKLPVLFVCENNCYAVSFPVCKSFGIPSISLRAAAYGIPGITVDGMDVLEVYKAAGQAALRARSGEGPSLMECTTYRFKGHFIGDPGKYRPDGEALQWQEKDPIERLKNLLVRRRVLGKTRIAAIEKEVSLKIQEAEKYAMDEPEPPAQDAFADIYA
jgi:pyruvate dehydrogenase E1 component alpha subunit